VRPPAVGIRPGFWPEGLKTRVPAGAAMEAREPRSWAGDWGDLLAESERRGNDWSSVWVGSAEAIFCCFFVSVGLGCSGCGSAKSRLWPEGTLTPRWFGGRLDSSSTGAAALEAVVSVVSAAPADACWSDVSADFLLPTKGMADFNQLPPRAVFEP